MMKKYSENDFAKLLEKAAHDPRLRTNLNVHESTEDAVNRLFIAAVPGSKFAIQRHPDKWELVTCVKGSFVCRTYDDAGRITDEAVMGKDVVTFQIPAGTWHNIEVLEPCVFLEVKPGPYKPVAPEDTLSIN